MLVVEDDADLRALIGAGLRGGGFVVDTAPDWPTADELLSLTDYDCVVLDRLLPHGDTLGALRARRADGWTTPVLFLSALHTLPERIAGFEHGADDYLPKPFAVAELVVRVRSLARRVRERLPVFLTCGDLEIDLSRREVRRGGVLLSLTPKEFAVLHVLMVRQGEVVSKSELIEQCWDQFADPVSNVVDAVVAGLRRKLGAPQPVRTVRGHGFLLGAGG